MTLHAQVANLDKLPDPRHIQSQTRMKKIVLVLALFFFSGLVHSFTRQQTLVGGSCIFFFKRLPRLGATCTCAGHTEYLASLGQSNFSFFDVTFCSLQLALACPFWRLLIHSFIYLFLLGLSLQDCRYGLDVHATPSPCKSTLTTEYLA